MEAAPEKGGGKAPGRKKSAPPGPVRRGTGRPGDAPERSPGGKQAGDRVGRSRGDAPPAWARGIKRPSTGDQRQIRPAPPRATGRRHGFAWGRPADRAAHPGPKTPAGRGAGTGPSACPAPQPGATSAGSVGRSGTPSAVGVAPAREPVDRRPLRSQGRERAGLDPPSCAGRAEVCSRKHCGLDHSDLSMPMRDQRSVPPGRPPARYGHPKGSPPRGEHGKNRDTVRR